MSRSLPQATPRGAVEVWHTDDQLARQLGTPSYAAVIRRRWRVFEAALRTLARPGGPAPLRVLDAGCGDGVNLLGLRRILTRLGGAWQLVAIDLSPVRAGRARAADRADGRIALASVTALPFPAALFDVVLCNHVIEHVPDAGAAAAEIARVLRPGGLAIVGVPNEGCAFGRLRNRVLQPSIGRTTDHVHFFTRDTLSRLLSGAGLQVAEVDRSGLLLPDMRVHLLVAATAAGRALLDAAGRVLPSQAQELIAMARRPA